ncbi:MAG: bifunctional demethylmenaquinone methyltransferase/2-methoxy-6-polyprenyl-1,4-benzoquinol methylase UbiE [Bacteroidia bacterium]|nr:bifunctional demethylmenaquinone methyltransferase/2-methoxy-6-polyprenyl-1,4-benzoquinol methylase UbiE [Bacteroidia bacterium]
MSVVLPYKESDLNKKKQVEQMFDNIAHRYDFLNRILSFGIDKGWRKKVVKLLSVSNPKLVLDMATGTADLALELSKIKGVTIKGVDLSEGMLEIGKKKVINKGLQGSIELLHGDSERILFNDLTFDAATVAFGVRNFENLEQGLTELARVLKPGGKLFVLEFSKPSSFPYKQVYNFYFKNILPTVGKFFSNDSSAYTYLPDSVNAFPDGENFAAIMEKCGFTSIERYPLTFGIATIYVGLKPLG